MINASDDSQTKVTHIFSSLKSGASCPEHLLYNGFENPSLYCQSCLRIFVDNVKSGKYKVFLDKKAKMKLGRKK